MSGSDAQLTPLRCLVVDDEELARSLLGAYISRLPNLTLVGSAANPLLAAGFLPSGIDLLFLDIQMPEMTGMEWLRTLPQRPQVILTTAYPQYAIESYQLEVTDYLLKPFSFERFLQAVQKAAEWKRLREKDEAKVQDTNGAKDFLMVKAGQKLVKIRWEDLLFVQAKGEYVQFHCKGGRHLSLQSLRHLEESLPHALFVRVHKSFLVNLRAIDSMEGNILHVAGEEIPVGASYKEYLMKALG